MQVRAYVGLGTNLGNRLLNLSEARRRLTLLGAHQPGPVVESEALLPPGDHRPQPRYLNSVDALDTTLQPLQLFRALKQIEQVMGRQGGERWAPRIIDLDLLLYGDLVLRSDELTIPHPRMTERWFVMQPLATVAPQMLWGPHGMASPSIADTE